MQTQPLEFRVWTGAKMEHDIMVGIFGNFYVNPSKGKDGLDENDKASLSPYNTKYQDTTPVMQYTGFKDTRNKKVFAGDIVSPMTDPENERRYWEVKHEYGCFWINDAPIYDYAIYKTKHRIHAPTYKLEDLEVVGTIYTDKELVG